MELIQNIKNFFSNITQYELTEWGIAVLVVIVFIILSPILSYILIKMFNWKIKDKEKIKNNPFYKPLKWLVVFTGVYIAANIVNPSSELMLYINRIYRIMVICLVAKGLVDLVDPKHGILKKMENDDMPDGNKTVANFTSKILKYVIYIGAGLLILTVFDINPTSLIAGLGVGSAVVALAAQDFVKNLISGFSIMSDRPFLVGDWITVGLVEGTVIEISFRCTKIKTADNSVVTIQNSAFTTNNVINWSRMEQRRYYLNIKLPLETNSDKIEKIVNRIQFVLENNKKVAKDSISVHFNTIALDGVNIYINMYTDIINYEEYLVFREEVNEQVLKVLESENVKIAYPGQNVYVHQVEEEVQTVETVQKKD